MPVPTTTRHGPVEPRTPARQPGHCHDPPPVGAGDRVDSFGGGLPGGRGLGRELLGWSLTRARQH